MKIRYLGKVPNPKRQITRIKYQGPRIQSPIRLQEGAEEAEGGGNRLNPERRISALLSLRAPVKRIRWFRIRVIRVIRGKKDWRNSEGVRLYISPSSRGTRRKGGDAQGRKTNTFYRSSQRKRRTVAEKRELVHHRFSR